MQITQSSKASPSDSNAGVESLKIELLAAVQPKIKLKPLQRILQMNGVPFDESMKLKPLRRVLCQYITSLHKGKRWIDVLNAHAANRESAAQSLEAHNEAVQHSWPQLVSPLLKQRLVQLFHDSTSKEALTEVTCASCAESISASDS